MGKIITDCAAVLRLIYGIAAGLCLVIFMVLSILRAVGTWTIASAAVEELMTLTQLYIIPLGVSFLVWRGRLREEDHMEKWQIAGNMIWQIVMILAAAAVMTVAAKLINLSRGLHSLAFNLPKSLEYYGVLAGGVGVIVQCAANVVILFRRGGSIDGSL